MFFNGIYLKQGCFQSEGRAPNLRTFMITISEDALTNINNLYVIIVDEQCKYRAITFCCRYLLLLCLKILNLLCISSSKQSINLQIAPTTIENQMFLTIFFLKHIITIVNSTQYLLNFRHHSTIIFFIIHLTILQFFFNIELRVNQTYRQKL